MEHSDILDDEEMMRLQETAKQKQIDTRNEQRAEFVERNYRAIRATILKGKNQYVILGTMECGQKELESLNIVMDMLRAKMPAIQFNLELKKKKDIWPFSLITGEYYSVRIDAEW